MEIYEQTFVTTIGDVKYYSKVIEEYKGRKYVVKTNYYLSRLDSNGRFKERKETEYFMLLDTKCFYVMNKYGTKMEWKRDFNRDYGVKIAQDILEKIFDELKGT